jgi:hypothetical protein
MLEQIADEIPARKRAERTLFASIFAFLLIIAADLLYFLPFIMLPADSYATAIIFRLLSWPVLGIGIYCLFIVLKVLFSADARKRWRVRLAGCIGLLALCLLIMDLLARLDVIMP